MPRIRTNLPTAPSVIRFAPYQQYGARADYWQIAMATSGAGRASVDDASLVLHPDNGKPSVPAYAPDVNFIDSKGTVRLSDDGNLLLVLLASQWASSRAISLRQFYADLARAYQRHTARKYSTRGTWLHPTGVEHTLRYLEASWYYGFGADEPESHFARAMTLWTTHTRDREMEAELQRRDELRAAQIDRDMNLAAEEGEDRIRLNITSVTPSAWCQGRDNISEVSTETDDDDLDHGCRPRVLPEAVSELERMDDNLPGVTPDAEDDGNDGDDENETDLDHGTAVQSVPASPWLGLRLRGHQESSAPRTATHPTPAADTDEPLQRTSTSTMSDLRLDNIDGVMQRAHAVRLRARETLDRLQQVESMIDDSLARLSDITQAGLPTLGLPQAPHTFGPTHGSEGPPPLDSTPAVDAIDFAPIGHVDQSH